LLKTLKSLRFTIFLVISLVSVFLLGVIIPQKDLLGREMYTQWRLRNPGLVSFLEAIRFTDIYISPITITLWVLFFTNLIFIMSKRIPTIWKRCLGEGLPANIDSVRGSNHHEIIDGVNMREIKIILKKIGYKVFDKDNMFWAVKNRFSPLATILFHLSFFLLLAGGVTSFYTQFRGGVELAVGETFMGQYNWMKRPKIGDIPWTRFTVEDIRPTYYNKTLPLNLDIVLQTKDGRKVASINKPYKEGRLSFVIKDIDVAPLFIIRDKEGREIDGAYVKLRGLEGKEDHFTMAGYEFRTLFYTDYYAGTRGVHDERADMPQALKQFPGEFSGGQQPKEIIHPAFVIAVLRDGRLITTKTMRIGQYIEFDGYRLIFSDLRYWVRFYVVKEYGLIFVYTGFILMVIALIVRFLLFRRDIRGVIEKGRLYIGGRGEFYPSLFRDEFKGIIEEIKKVVIE